MRRFSNCVTIIGIAVAAAGCGKNDGLLRTRCQVVKGDEAFVTPEDHHLQIEFVPVIKPGERLKRGMCYACDVNQATGEFRPDGPMKTGMPPGKYQVVLALLDENKKDVFGGKFDGENSPFIFEVDEDTDEIVIDLDDPPAQLQASAGG